MTQHLSFETSQLLHKLGVESKSGAEWYGMMVDVGKMKYRLCKVRKDSNPAKIPAYEFADILFSQEALKLLFGDYENIKYINNDPKRTRVYVWQFEAERLLRLLLAKDYSQAEQIIKQAAEERLKV